VLCCDASKKHCISLKLLAGMHGGSMLLSAMDAGDLCVSALLTVDEFA